MRILIVEDEPTLGRQLKTTLEQNGYAVDLSTDGEDGHFMGSTEDYDAVILDLGLPEIDGLTVLGMWRKEGRKFPVLAVSYTHLDVYKRQTSRRATAAANWDTAGGASSG